VSFSSAPPAPDGPVLLDAAAGMPLHPAARAALLAALDDGWADPAKVKAQTELVLQYAAGPDAKMPDLAQLFTNQFVGKVKLAGPALAAARKNAEPYRKYVG